MYKLSQQIIAYISQCSKIKRFIYFLALMVVLTIISNLFRSITIAHVNIVSPIATTIDQTIESNGYVQVNDKYTLQLPVGLKVEENYLSPNKIIKSGDKLLKLDAFSLDKEISKIQLELNRKKFEMLLSTVDKYDDTAISSIMAEHEVKNANLNYQYIAEKTSQEISIAQEDLSTSIQQYRKAKKYYLQFVQIGNDNSVLDTYEKAYIQYCEARKNYILCDINYKIAIEEQASDQEINNLRSLLLESKTLLKDATSFYKKSCTLFDKTFEMIGDLSLPLGISSVEGDSEKDTAYTALMNAKQELTEHRRSLDRVLLDSENQLSIAETTLERTKIQSKYTIESADYEKKENSIEKNLNEVIVKQFTLLTENIRALLEQLYAIQSVDAVVYADKDGQVLNISIVDKTVSNEQAVTFADLNSGISFCFTLSQEDATRVKPGNTGTIEINNEVFETTIFSISQKPDGDNNVELVAEIIGVKEDTVFMGNSGSIQVNISKNKNDLCLPANAIRSDASGSFVYLLEERQHVLGTEVTLTRCSVDILEYNNELVAVKGAITHNSKVLLSSNKFVGEGDRVRVVQ